MRYVEESDLKRLLREEGPLAPARTMQLLEEVADALDTAHAQGLIHRDVKPSNILISGQGEAEHSYLADFGLTRRAGEGAGGAPRMVGTVDYIAPEQIERDDVDARADVYALGCVLFECLTGDVPFPRDSDLAALWAHMRADPPRASELNPELPTGGRPGHRACARQGSAGAVREQRRARSRGARRARVVGSARRTPTRAAPAAGRGGRDRAPLQRQPRSRSAAVAIPRPRFAAIRSFGSIRRRTA